MQMPVNILAEQETELFFGVDTSTANFELPDPKLDTVLRAAIRSLTVMQKEAIVRSSRTGLAWRLVSDEGAYLNGHDAAPPPLAHLSAGMVASYMTEILALAEIRKIKIRRLELVQDNTYSMHGKMSDGTMTGGANDVSLNVKIDTDVDTDAIRALALDAISASPLNGLMRAPIESLFSLTHNNDILKPNKALALDHVEPEIDDTVFESITPSAGDWSGLLDPTGIASPKVEQTKTFAGGALTDAQNRMLHLRVEAKLREDGVKEITQTLYNPHGTIFRFLSDEEGRAPDAETLITAGIGFCFMTQLGRFAKMGRYDMRDYRITQDAHFSKAGASGGTGKAGTALPLETHVHLTTGEDDTFARHALDMAEQTCFLHAFCRTALKAKVSIETFS